MKKIFTLSILIASFSPSNASTIIYTDVNPDSVKSGNSTLNIDMDNDLTPDFQITGAASGPLSFDVVQGSQVGLNNFVLSDGNNNALCLAVNTIIGPTSTTWFQMNSTNLQMILVSNNVGSGTWSGATDKYLGLKFTTSPFTYYGWARFTFSSTSNMYTLKDYAYESAPNTQILAGYTGVGINDISLQNSVNVFPNPAHNSITINSNVNLSQTSIQLMNVTGEIVYDTSSENFSQATINLSKFARGIYLLRVENKNGILTKKIVIE